MWVEYLIESAKDAVEVCISAKVLIKRAAAVRPCCIINREYGEACDRVMEL